MNFALFPIVLLALFGGLLSIASPCGGLLIPLFFANTFKNKEKFFLNSLLFFIGAYSVSFLIVVGLYYIFLSFPLTNNFLKFVGIIFILIGGLSLFGKHLNLPGLKVDPLNIKKRLISSFMLGAFAAFSHGTCCGPILGVLATVAAKYNNLLISALIMFFYTLGMVFPLVLVSFGADKVNFIKKIFVKGKTFTFSFFGNKITIHSSNIFSFVFFSLSGLILIFFNGSIFSFLNLANIDLNFMIEYQDRLINFLLYK